MKFLPENDTIVALSTPLGSGAVAVIRLSGAQALEIVKPTFSGNLNAKNNRKALFGNIVNVETRATIDQVVVTYFQNPRSYTGEDVVEISCHCNALIIDRIINEMLKNGARVAEPGEFTLRAFLNGKMDLSQAEAVADIISARSRQSISQSLRHLEGQLSTKIFGIKNDILDNLALLEINLDFSDEEIEVMPVKEMSAKMQSLILQINELLNTYDYGRILHEGIKMLILGKPNVGKSSLLNQLLQRERAIVSEIPGTTRDYIEASLEMDGLAVQAVDTAGIRQTEDAIEAIGVERAIAQLESTDLALCIFDGSEALTEDDEVLYSIISDHKKEVQFVIVVNKADLPTNASTLQTLKNLEMPIVEISAKTAVGITKLKQTIKSQFFDTSSMESEEIVITSARHKAALEKTVVALKNAIEAMEMGATEEIISVDIRLALDHLGAITGETTPEDVINHIFANFCIGK